MSRENNRAILHLVAAGRLTGVEAERLMRAANEGRELAWFAVVAVAVCAAQSGLAAWGIAERYADVLPGVSAALRAAVSVLVTALGGKI